ncbi:hypothetical protein BOTCAL_0198g00010 [Botryotinia calthae]|uniref:ribonuclease H n=1 Tax=Botryotinia calthae TaxID=38488 RepID=A0A4Y8CZM0_9HELO|nr:hypothetical protein BOTCAL_0198g00010 [Botryotinia calthae]
MSYLAYSEADSFYYECGFYSPRAVVVAVDGACPGNGTIQAQKSSFGVFFGPDSPLNTYDTITRPSGEKHTNNYAELMAMLHALELLKHHSELRQWISKHPLLIDCTFKVGVIIITDSKFVNDCLTLWLANWSMNGFRTVEGNPVANKDLILRINHMIELLSGDLDIQIWHVRREHNQDADELAVRALQILQHVRRKHNRDADELDVEALHTQAIHLGNILPQQAFKTSDLGLSTFFLEQCIWRMRLRCSPKVIVWRWIWEE